MVHTPTAPDRSRGSDRTAAGERLGSRRGVGWLLSMGALVTGVSLYRLVETRWAGLSTPVQFLLLVAAALAVFGCGELARSRLRLPQAGAALLALFAGLVPILGWGATYLGLLGAPAGWAAFAGGVAALVLAVGRVLRSLLRYRGLGAPASLALFLVAQPALDESVRRGWWSADAAYTAAALVLGALLFLAGRHLNRFLFHRDRRDGRERPVSFVPFALLALLYLGSLATLEPLATAAALPLAILGVALAATGEEVLGAVAAAEGRAPERWPRRAVGLLAAGTALLVAALPLSLLDPSLRTTCLAGAVAAGWWGRWALRYGRPTALTGAFVAALAAYHAAPSLAPALAGRLRHVLLAVLGVPAGSFLPLGLADLAFLGLWLLVAGRLAARPVPGRERLGAVVAAAAGLLAVWVSGVGLAESLVAPGSAAPLTGFLALTAAVAALGAGRCHRPGLLVAAQMAAAVLVLQVARRALGERVLLTPGSGTLLAAAFWTLALAARWLGDRLAVRWRVAAAELRRALVLPAIVAGLGLAAHGALVGVGRDAVAALEVVVAGLAVLAAGARLRHAVPLAAGQLAVAGGAYLLAAALTAGWVERQALAVVAQALFTASWLGGRALGGAGAPAAAAWRPGLTLGGWIHAAVAVLLVWAPFAREPLAAEPTIFLLLALAMVDAGLARRDSYRTGVGWLLLALWAGVATAGLFWPQVSPQVAIAAAAVVLGVLTLAYLAVEHPRSPLRRRLLARYGLAAEDLGPLATANLGELAALARAAAAGVCLVWAGPSALGLAALVALSRMAAADAERRSPEALRDPWRVVPLRSLLPLVVQLSMLGVGGWGDRWLLPALVERPFGALAALASLTLGWQLLVAWSGRAAELRPWLRASSTLVAVLYAAAFLFGADLLPLANVVLVAVAVLWAAVGSRRAYRGGEARWGWSAQLWAGLAVLHGFTAGWLHLGSGWAPTVLLGVGASEYALAAVAERRPRLAAFVPSCRAVGLTLPGVAAGVAAVGWLVGPQPSFWSDVEPLFAVSLFYLLVAGREERRLVPASAAVLFLFAGLLAAFDIAGLGPRFLPLAPGLALIAAAVVLRPEMGPVWSRRVLGAGATCVYATPVAALAAGISWGWLVVLLLSALAFGALSFTIRSRTLLGVSTAALAADLGFFVFHLGTTEPLLLWVAGFLFGLALMAVAGWLESRREGLAQQLRVWGRELRAWS